MNILRQTDGYVYIDLTPSQFEECGVTQVDQPVVKIEGETYKVSSIYIRGFYK